eukprot:TRINITY_DN7656_c0_g1_i8.p1 TRINITY_DN7656_c0_g1~~TRINITY_DN7656_c0_g1_i8.p1  ORF type:complete len:3291 (-),score=595.66 TRINITY_DN7656_c0_g1_i8:202-9333(-)
MYGYVNNNRSINGTYVWSGQLSGQALLLDTITTSVTVQFDTVHGVKSIMAGVTYTDPSGLLDISGSVSYSPLPCDTPTDAGYSQSNIPPGQGQGVGTLSLHDMQDNAAQDTSFTIAIRHEACAQDGDVVWNVLGMASNVMLVRGLSLRNLTVELVAIKGMPPAPTPLPEPEEGRKRKVPFDQLVNRTTPYTNSTQLYWQGVVFASVHLFEASDAQGRSLDTDIYVIFDSEEGVRRVQANFAFSSDFLLINANIDYSRDAATTPSYGAGSITVKDIGHDDITIGVDILYDQTQTNVGSLVWNVTGYMNEYTINDDVSIDSVRLTALGRRSANASRGYEWSGIAYGAMQLFEIETETDIHFSALDGLQFINAHLVYGNSEEGEGDDGESGPVFIDTTLTYNSEADCGADEGDEARYLYIGTGTLGLALNDDPIEASLAAYYSECGGDRQISIQASLSNWHVSDLELEQLEINLLGTVTSVTHGLVTVNDWNWDGEINAVVDLFGASTATSVLFNNKEGLQSVNVLLSYVDSMLNVSSSLAYTSSSGCPPAPFNATELEPGAEGGVSIQVNSLSSSPIVVSGSVAYNNCTDSILVIHGEASLPNTINGLALEDISLDLVASRSRQPGRRYKWDGTVSGTVSFFNILVQASASFTAGGTDAGLKSVIVHLDYNDPQINVIRVLADMAWDANCAVPILGRGQLILPGMASGSTGFVIDAKYQRCASIGQTQWEISGRQDGYMALSSFTLSNTTVTLVGVKSSNTTTFWNGTLAGIFQYEAIQLKTSVGFNSRDGITGVKAALVYDTEYLRIEITIDYAPAANCTIPGAGVISGAGLVIIRKIGSDPTKTLTLSIAATHNTCEDTWAITGDLSTTSFSVAGLSFTSLHLELFGEHTTNMSRKNDTSLKAYDWEGALQGTVAIPDLDGTFDVDINFESIKGLKDVSAAFTSAQPYGTLELAVQYASAANAGQVTSTPAGCASRRLIYAEGTFSPTLSNSAAPFLLSVKGTYDTCTKAWTMNGALLPTNPDETTIQLYDLVLADVTTSVQGSYNNVTRKTDWNAAVSGYVSLFGSDAFLVRATFGKSGNSSSASVFIMGSSNPTSGMVLTASIAYSTSIPVLNATGAVTLIDFPDTGKNFSFTCAISFCKTPLQGLASSWPYQWYITAQTAMNMPVWGANVAGTALITFSKAATKLSNSTILLNNNWNGAIMVAADFGNGISGSATIITNGARVASFILAASLSWGTPQPQVKIDAQISIIRPAFCTSGSFNTGSGSFYLGNIPNLESFTANVNWQSSCNNSGYWRVTVDVPQFSFTLEEKTFHMAGLTLVASRARTGANPHVVLSGLLSDAKASVEFDLPFSNLAMKMVDAASSSPTARLKKPGDVLGMIGNGQAAAGAAVGNYQSVMPPVGGQFQAVYADILSGISLRTLYVEFQPSAKSILVQLGVTIYGADVNLFFSAKKVGTTWAFAVVLQMDFTRMNSANLPSSFKTFRSLNIQTLNLAFASASSTFTLPNGGGTLDVVGGAMQFIGTIAITDPGMQAFMGNVNPATPLGQNARAGGAVLKLYCSISSSNLLVLISLAGNVRISNGVYAQELALSIDITPVSFKFGFLARLAFDIKGTGDNKLQLVALAQMYLVAGATPSLGILIAACSTEPWEIIPNSNVYLLFPIKISFAVGMIGPVPFITQFGFGGGLRLGRSPNTAVSAYTMAQIDLSDVSKTAFYFNLNNMDMSNIITYFVGKTPPSWANLISIGDLVINYNPKGSGGGGAGGYIAPTSSSGATADCSTAALLNFNPPLPGIILSISNLNLFNGFLSFRTITMNIVPSQSIEGTIQMNQFTLLPGVSLTDASGRSGPIFYLKFNYVSTPPIFDIMISGQVKVPFLNIAVELRISPTLISGFGYISLGSFFRAQVRFSFTPTNPLAGMSVGISLEGSTDALANEMLNVIKAINDGINSQMAVAQGNLQNAQRRLQDAQNNLVATQRSVDARFGDAINTLNNAQNRVNSLGGSCNHYSSNCKWYKPWNCVAAGGCWIAYGVATGALEVAKAAVRGVQATVDAAFAAARGAISLASSAVSLSQLILSGLQKLVQASLALLGSAMNSIRSLLTIRTLSASATIGNKIGGSYANPGQLSLAYDLSIVGYALSGNIQIDLTWNFIVNWLKENFTTVWSGLITNLSRVFSRDTSSMADMMIGAAPIEMPIDQICTNMVNASGIFLNPLSQVPGAVIPACLFEVLPKLKFLNLANSSLSGTIPSFVVPTLPPFQDTFLPLTVEQIIAGHSEYDINNATLRNQTVFDEQDGGEDILPESHFLVSTNLINFISLELNNLTGNIPASFSQLTSLEFLDVSDNSLSGGLDNLLNNTATLKYMDLSYNNFNDDASSMLLGDWLSHFKDLDVIDFRGNNFNIEKQAGILQPLDIQGVMVALRVNFDSDDVCGRCLPSVQVSGTCHLETTCADLTPLYTITSQIQTYLFSKDDDNYIPPESTEILVLHMMRYCQSSTLLLIQFINPKADLVFVRSIFNSMAQDTEINSLVTFARARTACGPGRLGASCSYFCQLGWRRMAPMDMQGGYLPSPMGGSSRKPSSHQGEPTSGDIYDNLLPFCMLPTGCGTNCTLAVRAIQDTCLDYLDTFASFDLQACRFSIQAASELCHADQIGKCVTPVVTGIMKLLPIADNVNVTHLINNPQAGMVAITFSISVVQIVPAGSAPATSLTDYLLTLLTQLLRARALGYNMFLTDNNRNVITYPPRVRDVPNGEVAVVTYLNFTTIVNETDSADVKNRINNYINNRMTLETGIDIFPGDPQRLDLDVNTLPSENGYYFANQTINILLRVSSLISRVEFYLVKANSSSSLSSPFAFRDITKRSSLLSVPLPFNTTDVNAQWKIKVVGYSGAMEIVSESPFVFSYYVPVIVSPSTTGDTSSTGDSSSTLSTSSSLSTTSATSSFNSSTTTSLFSSITSSVSSLFSTSSTSSFATSTTSDGNNGALVAPPASSQLSPGAIAGIVIAVLVVVAGVAVGVFLFLRRRAMSNKELSTTMMTEMDDIPSADES